MWYLRVQKEFAWEITSRVVHCEDELCNEVLNTNAKGKIDSITLNKYLDVMIKLNLITLRYLVDVMVR